MTRDSSGSSDVFSSPVTPRSTDDGDGDMHSKCVPLYASPVTKEYTVATHGVGKLLTYVSVNRVPCSTGTTPNSTLYTT